MYKVDNHILLKINFEMLYVSSDLLFTQHNIMWTIKIMQMKKSDAHRFCGPPSFE